MISTNNNKWYRQKRLFFGSVFLSKKTSEKWKWIKNTEASVPQPRNLHQRINYSDGNSRYVLSSSASLKQHNQWPQKPNKWKIIKSSKIIIKYRKCNRTNRLCKIIVYKINRFLSKCETNDSWFWSNHSIFGQSSCLATIDVASDQITTIN